jgi:hypothetical protein
LMISLHVELYLYKISKINRLFCRKLCVKLTLKIHMLHGKGLFCPCHITL